MADFEFRNIEVYKIAKEFHKEVQDIITKEKPGKVISDQLNRASLSIVLNIAEGYGRFQKGEKRHLYTIARASVNETIACLDIIFDSAIPEETVTKAVTLSKMISGLINRFK